jgi:hypothetical protein
MNGTFYLDLDVLELNESPFSVIFKIGFYFHQYSMKNVGTYLLALVVLRWG